MDEITKITAAGNKKIDFALNHPLQFFLKAFMAGLYLGGAMIISYTGAAILSTNYPEFGKLFLAFTFGIGLAAIVFLGAELFTGNCFSTAISVYNKERTLKQIIPAWILCYIGNITGIALIGFILIKSGANQSALSAYLHPLMESKLNYEPIQLILKGILCNYLVCIAAYSGIKMTTEPAKFSMIIFFVAAFVLPGLDHCIANGGFWAMGLTLFGSEFSFGAICLHMLYATIGNIIGGSFLLGLPIFFMNKEK